MKSTRGVLGHSFLHSFARSLAHSLAPELVGQWNILSNFRDVLNHCVITTESVSSFESESLALEWISRESCDGRRLWWAGKEMRTLAKGRTRFLSFPFNKSGGNFLEKLFTRTTVMSLDIYSTTASFPFSSAVHSDSYQLENGI